MAIVEGKNIPWPVMFGQVLLTATGESRKESITSSSDESSVYPVEIGRLRFEVCVRPGTCLYP